MFSLTQAQHNLRYIEDRVGGYKGKPGIELGHTNIWERILPPPKNEEGTPKILT